MITQEEWKSLPIVDNAWYFYQDEMTFIEHGWHNTAGIILASIFVNIITSSEL